MSTDRLRRAGRGDGSRLFTGLVPLALVLGIASANACGGGSDAGGNPSGAGGMPDASTDRAPDSTAGGGAGGTSGAGGAPGDAAPDGAGGGPVEYSILGRVFAGRVSGARVDIYPIDVEGERGERVASVAADTEGRFGVDVANAGAYLLVATGGTFEDLATGESRPLGELRGLTLALGDRGRTCRAMISPLTELTLLGARGLESDDFTEAAAAMRVLWGASDVFCDEPADPTVAGPSNELARDHGLAIAALSKLAATRGEALATTLSELAEDLVDENTTLRDEYALALQAFADSPRNATGASLESSGLPSGLVVAYGTVPLEGLHVARCGAIPPPCPLDYRCDRSPIRCDPPNTTEPLRTDVGLRPAGEICTLDSCSVGQLARVPGQYGFVYQPRVFSNKLINFEICDWYFQTHDGIGCPGGIGIRRADRIMLPEDGCDTGTCWPKIELVVPPDTRITGSLIIHDGALHRATFPPLYHWPIMFPPSVDAALYPRCPSSETCLYGLGDSVAPATPTTRTYTFLTTYGYEWSLTIQAPAPNQVRRCDIMTGACLDYAAQREAGDGGTDAGAGESSSCREPDGSVRRITKFGPDGGAPSYAWNDIVVDEATGLRWHQGLERSEGGEDCNFSDLTWTQSHFKTEAAYCCKNPGNGDAVCSLAGARQLCESQGWRLPATTELCSKANDADCFSHLTAVAGCFDNSGSGFSRGIFTASAPDGAYGECFSFAEPGVAKACFASGPASVRCVQDPADGG